MWTSLLKLPNLAENSKRNGRLKEGGQAVFFGGEKCGKIVDKWK